MLIYIDSSDLDYITSIKEKIDGVTTNPSIMKKGGVTDYLGFAKRLADIGLPVSLEVFADDFTEMKRQAIILSELGLNVYVKIPVMNTKREYSYDLIKDLSCMGIKVNVTAVFTFLQVIEVCKCISKVTPSIISIFAGRIADTGGNPKRIIQDAVLERPNKSQILWASVREVWNIYEAQFSLCDIITVPPDIYEKYIKFKGKNLEDFSMETVQMFHRDAAEVGYII